MLSLSRKQISLPCYYARRLLIFSEGKGNGNAWAYRDKISLYAEIAMI